MEARGSLGFSWPQARGVPDHALDLTDERECLMEEYIRVFPLFVSLSLNGAFAEDIML